MPCDFAVIAPLKTLFRVKSIFWKFVKSVRCASPIMCNEAHYDILIALYFPI